MFLSPGSDVKNLWGHEGVMGDSDTKRREGFIGFRKLNVAYPNQV
jgi:hypothetical protein